MSSQAALKFEQGLSCDPWCPGHTASARRSSLNSAAYGLPSKEWTSSAVGLLQNHAEPCCPNQIELVRSISVRFLLSMLPTRRKYMQILSRCDQETEAHAQASLPDILWPWLNKAQPQSDNEWPQWLNVWMTPTVHTLTCLHQRQEKGHNKSQTSLSWETLAACREEWLTFNNGFGWKLKEAFGDWIDLSD